MVQGRPSAADFQSLIGCHARNYGEALTVAIPSDLNGYLPLAEYTRAAMVTGAINREIDVIFTNSDGNPERRDFLLTKLGPGATERIVDPGIDVVRARLADSITGDLEPECEQAIGRWYGRR